MVRPVGRSADRRLDALILTGNGYPYRWWVVALQTRCTAGSFRKTLFIVYDSHFDSLPGHRDVAGTDSRA